MSRRINRSIKYFMEQNGLSDPKDNINYYPKVRIGNIYTKPENKWYLTGSPTIPKFKKIKNG